MTNGSLKEISVEELLGKGNNRKHGNKSFILSYVRQNPEGVTVKMTSNAAGISEQRTRVLLNDLCKGREIYDRKVPGIKEKLYYPNGKLIHKYLQQSKDFGSQIIRVSFHEGKRNPRVQIQERKYTLLDGEKVQGSIFIDIENITGFLELIEKMLVKFNQHESKKNN